MPFGLKLQLEVFSFVYCEATSMSKRADKAEILTLRIRDPILAQ